MSRPACGGRRPASRSAAASTSSKLTDSARTGGTLADRPVPAHPRRDPGLRVARRCRSVRGGRTMPRGDSMGEGTRRVVVLGAGMVGAAIARDLRPDAELRVDVADLRPEALARVAAGQRRRHGARRPRGRRRRPRLVAGYDLVVGALPSVIGFADPARGDRGRPRPRRHQLHAGERARARRARARARRDRGRRLRRRARACRT